MKYQILFLSHLFLSCSLLSFAQNPQWHYVGDTTISDDYSGGSLMAFYNDLPYIAHKGNCAAGWSTVVRRFDGNDWVMVDSTGLGDKNYACFGISSSGKLQLAYFDNQRFGIKRLENDIWITVSESPEITDPSYKFSFAFEDESLFVAFREAASDDQILVWQFNGNNWSELGQPILSPGGASDIILKVSDGTPWLAYLEPNLSKTCVVKKLDGSDWQAVGGPVFSGTFRHEHFPHFVYHAPVIDFSVSHGIPFIAYADSTTGYHVSVVTFNGTEWSNVGQPEFTTPDVSKLKLAIDTSNNIPYVLFNDLDLGISGASSMRFNGNSWEYVGNRLFSQDYWSAIFEIYEGIPFFAYEPPLFCPKISVQAFSPLTPVVEPRIPEISFSIHPNPLASELLYLRIHTFPESGLAVQLTDMQGRLIIEQNLQHANGLLEHLFHIKDVTNGMYMIQLVAKNGEKLGAKQLVVIRSF